MNGGGGGVVVIWRPWLQQWNGNVDVESGGGGGGV